MAVNLKTLMALGLAAALLQASPGRAAAVDPDDAASVARGLRLAQRNCAQCHAIASRGESPNRSAPAFRELHRRYPADSLEEAFAAGLLTRHPAMPQLRLLPGEMADLTAYVKSVRSRGETEASLQAPRLVLARR
jgi:mono/diheme cytochrome c family protein